MIIMLIESFLPLNSTILEESIILQLFGPFEAASGRIEKLVNAFHSFRVRVIADRVRIQGYDKKG